MSRYDLSFDNGVIAYNSEPDTDVYLTSTADKESFKRDNIVIYAQAGNDKISIGADSANMTISGGAGNDTVYFNENGSVYQYAGGKDVIVTIGSSANVLTIKNVLIEQLVAGEGVIIADDIPTLISGTRAANRMEYDLNHATLQALGGNDTVINSGNVIEYAQGDGKDVIFGFGGKDSVQITEGEISKFDDVSEITATNYSVGDVETGTVELEQDTLSAAMAYSQEK